MPTGFRKGSSRSPSTGPLIKWFQGRTECASYCRELVTLVIVLCDEAGISELTKALVKDTWGHRVASIAEGACPHGAVS